MSNDRVASTGWRGILRGTLLILTGFTCGGILILLVYDWNPGEYATTPPRDLNLTHVRKTRRIKGKPLERVTINNFTDNIYFTVKTSAENYRSRLSLLLLMWFQTVNKSKLTIVSDSPDEGALYVNTIRSAGFNLILTDCFKNHSAEGLCCKTGTEFESYYKTVEDHKNAEESYQWFCHIDDDVYVNVPQLSHQLQQFDPHKPYYIGKWPGMARRYQPFVNLTLMRSRRIQRMNHMVKAKTFQYATGSAYCISHALMMEVEQFFNGKKKFCESGQLVLYRDDMSIGVIIGVIMGYNLTNIDDFHCQYEDLHGATLQQMLHYITVGYKAVNENGKMIFDNTVPLKSPFKKDPTKFLAYHCLLYPQVSWCKNQWSTHRHRNPTY